VIASSTPPGPGLATTFGMSQTAPTWNDVRRIADELRLELHLAGMDARDRWKSLQPKLIELEHVIETKGHEVGHAIAEQLAALGHALDDLRKRIADNLDPPR
jgi:hypothetical protein